MLQNQRLCATNGTGKGALRRRIYTAVTLSDLHCGNTLNSEHTTKFCAARMLLVVGRCIYTLTTGREAHAALLDLHDLHERPARPCRAGGRRSRATGGHTDEFHLS